MSTPSERYLKQATVNPHWINPHSFWYLRTTASVPSTTEFILVEATATDESSRRRPAFDHSSLASKLADYTGQGVDPSNLPFRWIEFTKDGDLNSVRFRFSGKVFEYKDGELGIWGGEFGKKLEPLDGDIVTIHGGPPTDLTIVNKTATTVKVYWIDGSGKNLDYGSVDGNGENTLQTYVDHAWLLEGENGEKARYRAVEGAGFIVIEPGWGQPKEALAIRIKETDELNENRDLADREIFVRDGDVWIRDSDGEHQVTQVNDDPSGFRFDPWKITKSPDGKFAVVWKYTSDDPEGYILYRIESTPADQLQPKVHKNPYPKPGEKFRVDRPCMFDLEAKRELPTDDALFNNPYSIKDSELGWSPDSQEYRFEFNERGHKHLRIIGMNREGVVRAIVDDSSETFIDYSQKRAYHLSPDATELIWGSERDGWNHLYLYDLSSGQVKNQITKGEWVVREIEKISWETRQIWLTVYGVNPSEDPYYAHLARVHLDDPSQFTLLTSGNGTHSWKWSPSETSSSPYLFDTFSRVDQLPITILRDASTGTALVTIEDDATPSLLAEGWIPPQIFTAPGRDNQTPIYGIIIPPTDLNPTKKYPILEDIYASPHNFFTPKSFQSAWDLSSQYELSSAGFVVVKLDGMGTNWRSKAFHSVCHKNLKDAGIPDRISWIKSAAETRPWMDLDRVGIYGGSAGGQSAVASLIFHHDPDSPEQPPFYKAAAADCGCHDNRIDKLWWNEAWMGYPLDEAYESNSNIVHADKLRGQVLLTVGEMDDNVDPASTLQLVKRLNDLANHDYEMLYMPGLEHGAGGGDYGRVRRLRFFQRVLGGPVDV